MHLCCINAASSFKTIAPVLPSIHLRRFDRAHQLTAYAGDTLRVVESGTSVRGKTRMCKRGNERVRHALYLSAMATLNTKRPNTLSLVHQTPMRTRQTRKGRTWRRDAQTTHHHARSNHQWITIRSNVQRVWKTQSTTGTGRGNFDLTSNRLPDIIGRVPRKEAPFGHGDTTLAGDVKRCAELREDDSCAAAPWVLPVRCSRKHVLPPGLAGL